MTDTQPATLPVEQLEHLADVGNKALNDHYHDDVCACRAWPANCGSRGGYFFGYWDTSAFAIALPAIIAAYEQAKKQPNEPTPGLTDDARRLDTLRLHGGPADGVTYRHREGDDLPAHLQLSIQLALPDGHINDLPPALINGEIHAVHQYRHVGDGNYQHQEPATDGHDDCWGAHNGTDGPVDCDGRPI